VKPFDFASLWRPELSPWEVSLRAAIIYLFIQLLFRVAGRKELGRWGLPEVALLFLVTTASRMSVVADDPSLTSAMVALVTIVALDRLLSYLSFRSARLADLLEGPVRQLVRDGELQRDALRRTQISEDELLAKLREKGKTRLDQVKDAFFERSGTVTFVFREG
jgi:uncharacterized membrane protein YcaP (DUF421 family)